MAAQHAIHGVGGAANGSASLTADTAAKAEQAARPRGEGRGALLASLRRALRPGKRGSWSVWRVAAVAILSYVVAVNLSYFLVLKPIWSRLNVLVEKKGVIQDFLIVRESASAVSGFRDGLMHGDQRMSVVAEFEDLAAEAGLRMVGDPGLLPQRELSDRIVEYPVEIELRGSYHEVGRFLSLLEASSRCPLVTEVEVTGGESGSGLCSVRVRLGVPAWAE
jgi:Tfp pilus assembly protein PilO